MLIILLALLLHLGYVSISPRCVRARLAANGGSVASCWDGRRVVAAASGAQYGHHYVWLRMAMALSQTAHCLHASACLLRAP
jgi:hypothetical protein